MSNLLELSQSIVNFDNYKNTIFKMPRLTANEEYLLAIDIVENKNLTNAKKLIYHNLYLVVSAVYKFRGYNISQDDLMQEGTIGLMKAVKNFNPYKKIRLSSYAIHWIEAEIKEFILSKWSLIKGGTTKTFKKLFFSYRKTMQEIENIDLKKHFSKNKREQLAYKLNVNIKDIEDIENFFSINNTVEIFQKNNNDEDNNQDFTIDIPVNGFEEVEEDEENINNKKIISNVMKLLNDREAKIIKNRYILNKTLKEISHEEKISIERVRQIETEALKKAKTYFLNDK